MENSKKTTAKGKKVTAIDNTGYTKVETTTTGFVLALFAIVMQELQRLCNLAKAEDKDLDAIAYLQDEKNVNKAITNCQSQKTVKDGKTVSVRSILNARGIALIRPIFKAGIFSQKVLNDMVKRHSTVKGLYTELNSLNKSFALASTLSTAFNLSAENRKVLNKTVRHEFFNQSNETTIQQILFVDSFALAGLKTSLTVKDINVARLSGEKGLIAVLKAHNLTQQGADTKVAFDVAKAYKLARFIPESTTPRKPRTPKNVGSGVDVQPSV